MSEKPERVRSAPGLVWKRRRNEIWEARWQCRTDILAKGYLVKSVKLWSGTGEPIKEDWDFLAETCKSLQMEMLNWSRGDEPKPIRFDKRTLGSLMECYQTDLDSPYKKLRYASRIHYDVLIRLIKKDYGSELLEDINARAILKWYNGGKDENGRQHDGWASGGKIAAGHAKIGMMRILFGFGFALLENDECERMSNVLGKLTFKMPEAREEAITLEQAVAVRREAHARGRPSVALAQAFQWDGIFRQKDVIGEYVPLNEPVMSDVIVGKFKWVRGLRWEEISSRLVLTHITSKRSKKLVLNLKNAPMVMEELEYIKAQYGGQLPSSGPIIRNEYDGHPWDATEFRRWWRILASSAGVPDSVRNMDSRAGAISEADDLGADLDDIREAATHSNVSMTRRYSRHKERKIEQVQLARIAGRNRTEKSDD